MAEVSKLGRVIAYDRRGCSRSQRPEPYVTTSVPEHADGAALLKALRATPAIVIGRSYGGEVAVDLAIRYPYRVRALVLLEAPILGLVPEADLWLEELNDRVRAAAAQDMETVGERFIRAIIGDDAWKGLPEELKRMFKDNGPAILAEVNGGDLAVDPAVLSTINHPTLIVGAADSPGIFRDVNDRIAAAIPNSTEVVAEGGHMVDPAHPEVIRFLQGILSGS